MTHTTSDNSDTNIIINIKYDDDNIDDIPDITRECKILTRCNSSYDELLSSQDFIIIEKNEIKCDTHYTYDGVEDSKTHFTSSSSFSSNNYFEDNEYCIYDITHKVTTEHIKNKYSIENTACLELDYSINYNMKLLTHLGNYYNILKHNNNSGCKLSFNIKNTSNTQKELPKEKLREKPKKMLKNELIHNIVSFETNEANHPVVYKYRKMLEKIDELKTDKYFAPFILFP